MNAFSWFRRDSSASSDDGLLAEAREHARAGRLDEASQTYWKIKGRHETLDGLIEHAELLLQLGDFFGAATKAARARHVDPDNARAIAVQKEIVRREEHEERLRASPKPSS